MSGGANGHNGGLNEMIVESVRVHMLSNRHVVILKDPAGDRYLPIWIGPFEADAITIQLQGVQVARPLTHDLLKSVIDEMGAKISHVMVNELKNDTFFARIVMAAPCSSDPHIDSTSSPFMRRYLV